MKALIILSMEMHNDPRIMADALRAIDPPQVPGFTGTARVVLDPEASALEEWLDAGEVINVEAPTE